jgi:hypothetical protein
VVDEDAVRTRKHPRTEASDEITIFVEKQDRIKLRHCTRLAIGDTTETRTASLENPDALAVVVDSDCGHGTILALWEFRPVLDGSVRIGKIIDRLKIVLGERLASGQCDQSNDHYCKRDSAT